MLTLLENDNRLKELRDKLAEKEIAINDVPNKGGVVDTKRIDQLMSSYSNNKLNNETKYREIKRAKRCEIWYVNLGKRNGSCQCNIRPFLITSNSLSNQYSTIVNGFPITSKVSSKANIPVHVEIENFGLKEKSLVLTEQITTIDVRYDLLTYVGTVDELTMKRIDNARNIQLGDLKEKTPLEKLNKEIRIRLEEKLEDIHTYEKAIARRKTESLVKHLLEEREIFLMELEDICKENGLDYRDYYKIYKTGDESVVM